MAGLIKASDIEEVKARTNIADIIGEYVTLKGAGVGSLKGLCPFHEERSPSFNVRPQAGFYHCFGCGEGGDVYKFLQRIDHVSFTEAVERLASRIGFQLHYEDGGATPNDGNRARLLAANRDAEAYFGAQLDGAEGAIARRFFAERGFNEVHAKHFGLGYAPNSWDSLASHLKKLGYKDHELVAAGLLTDGERGSYDRFRGRAIWPIRDITGATVGFGARRLRDDDKGPKYLNTPETKVYHKAQVLYGLDLAKREIAKRRQVVVVEGYTDVMACHAAGITTAVATCGTAFGTDHIAALRRILGDDDAAGEVIFTFDPDAAGQKAALRAFSQERRFSAQTYVAVGPDGLDPCDLRLRGGDAALLRMLETKVPMFQFVIATVLAEHNLDTVEGRVAALRTAAPIVAGIRDPAVRPGYTRELARMLGMELPEVTRVVAGAARHQSSGAPHPGGAATRGGVSAVPEERTEQPRATTFAALGRDPVSRLERDGLAAVLQVPDALGEQRFQDFMVTPLANPTLSTIRDAMHVTAAERSSGWLQAIVGQLPEPLRPVARELALAPLPERSEEALPGYVRGIVASLLAKGIVAQKASLMGQLQRAEPASEQSREIAKQLAALEIARRRLESDEAS